MRDEKLDGQQIVGLMNQWMLPMWAITESVLDDNDPIKQIADVRRVSHSENEVEIKVVFQNSFLMAVFESLTQDNKSRFNFQVPKTFVTKFAEFVLAEAKAYQEKTNSHLPAVSVDDIQDDLTTWLELAGYLAITAGLAQMDMQDYSEYPNHIIAYLSMVSSYREDKDGFLEFIKNDLGLPDSRLAYVWEKLYTIFKMSADQVRDISPEKFFNYVRTSVKRGFNDYRRKFEKDPILRQIEDKLARDGEKSIDRIFAEIFPFDQVPENEIDMTFNSLEDIGILENIIFIDQACQKLKGVKSEQAADLRDLLIIRAIFDLSYSEAGILLGWSEKKVDKIYKFYKRHEKSFKQKLIS